MPVRNSRPSVSVPIALASFTVIVAIAMLTAWIIVISKNYQATSEFAKNTWLLVLGILSLLFIITIIVVLCVYLVREIREATRQSNFIDSVTHELKSPLASLKLCVQTMERPELSIDQRDQLHKMMLGDLDRLNVFIDDILAASRYLNTVQTYGAEPIELSELTQECCKRVLRRHKLPDSYVNFTGSKIEIVSDQTLLETVIQNLLDNAIKYSNPSSDKPIEARIFSQKAGRLICIEIQDHGIGLERRHLKTIFDRFYRISRKEVRSRQGTGLGLYVVAGLVRVLGGKIHARSRGLNQGSTFSIRLKNKNPVATLT